MDSVNQMRFDSKNFKKAEEKYQKEKLLSEYRPLSKERFCYKDSAGVKQVDWKKYNKAGEEENRRVSQFWLKKGRETTTPAFSPLRKSESRPQIYSYSCELLHQSDL